MEMQRWRSSVDVVGVGLVVRILGLEVCVVGNGA